MQLARNVFGCLDVAGLTRLAPEHRVVSNDAYTIAEIVACDIG
jgi:hypothetical protein